MEGRNAANVRSRRAELLSPRRERLARQIANGSCTMDEVKDKLTQYDLFDGAILWHGFTRYMRDYDIIAEIMPYAGPDHAQEPGVYRYRFTHCPEAHVVTCIRDDVWPDSWSDINLDYALWEKQGNPDGFVWGVCWACAYPGLSYHADSALAAQWSQRLRKPMREIQIETNVYRLQLVFHDVIVEKLDDKTPILNQVSIPVENK
jgi:hypothetical protein